MGVMMKYQYWLAWHAEKIGVRKINCLLEQGYSAERIYHMTSTKIEQTDWDFKWAKEILLQKQIQLVTQEQSTYPEKLRSLLDRPYGLFIKGRLPDENNKSVAIVGARRCSEYGRAVAGKIGEKLADSGVQVISGLALGIDSASHYGALGKNSEKSISHAHSRNSYAVLGCGVDICYPPSNQALYEKIALSGGLISEYPPETAPLPHRFPMRNRIISGLSDIVVVVEAKEKSGSLITADCALEQGREIYAVPGRISDPLNAGCNRLIEQGAGIIISVEDFLKDMQILHTSKTGQINFSKKSLEKEELLVYALLDLQPKNISEIINELEWDISKTLKILSGLQQQGLIQEVFKNYYIRTLS